MSLLIETLHSRAEEERRRLSRGERPAPRIPGKLQRAAVRGLAGFFALMLLFTLLSRAAEGATIPRVTVESPKSGILNQRLSLPGTLEPQGDLILTLPGGLEVNRIPAKEGQRVEQGDVLLELNQDALSTALEKLRNDMRILELRLDSARQGNTGTGTSAILSAQAALEAAQEDYDRLVSGRARAEARAGQALEAAQEDYDKALLALDRAGEKAKKALVDEAQDKADAAAENLKSVKESTQAAIESAQAALTSAQDAQKSYSKGYYDAVESLGKLKDQLGRARQSLDALVAAGASEAEIQAAQDKVDALSAQVDAAEWGVPNYDYGSDLAVRRAKDNLTKVTERQNEKVKEAQSKADEAQTELKKAKARTDVEEEALVVSAQSALDAAAQALENAGRAGEDAALDTESQLLAARRSVQSAQRTLDDARRAAEDARRTDADSRRQAEIERLGYLSEQRALKEQLETLEEIAAADGKLTSPIAGTVRSILSAPGKTQEGAQAAVLSRSDQGFVFSAQMNEKDVEHLSAGDKGSLSYLTDGENQRLDAQVTAIGAPDSEGKVRVTASLPAGSYPSGASATLEIARQSKQYGTTVPLGALRSDADGDFILVLRERQSVLGTELTAERVSVELLDQDSELAAVEGGGLTRDARVVTTASKPVSEGDKVRLDTPEQ